MCCCCCSCSCCSCCSCSCCIRSRISCIRRCSRWLNSLTPPSGLSGDLLFLQHLQQLHPNTHPQRSAIVSRIKNTTVETALTGTIQFPIFPSVPQPVVVHKLSSQHSSEEQWVDEVHCDPAQLFKHFLFTEPQQVSLLSVQSYWFLHDFPKQFSLQFPMAFPRSQQV
jgi:hypothetical protein